MAKWLVYLWRMRIGKHKTRLFNALVDINT